MKTLLPNNQGNFLKINQLWLIKLATLNNQIVTITLINNDDDVGVGVGN